MKNPKTRKTPAKRKAPARSVGRPAYMPKTEDRMSVERMVYCGEGQRVIAAAIGIDINTLRKHFAVELLNGHANRRREIIDKMFEAVTDGNSAVTKRLEEMGRVAAAVDRVEQREKPAPAVGKKEARKAAADAVTGKFAPPEGPKLIVSNR